MRKLAMKKRQVGFNLIELAIGLVIIGLVAGGGLLVVGTQMEQNRYRETQRTLDLAKDALLGFAALNGRFPCPASATGGGLEDPPGGGACNGPSDANGYYGFLPAVTLGIANGRGNCAPGPGAATGNLTDSWNGCIRYAVTRANANAATTTNGIRNLTPWTSFSPTLRICENAACTQVLTATAVAVVFSSGKNNSLPVPPANAHETENIDADRDFVRHEPRQSGQPGGEYDDLVDWLPLTVFATRMVQSAQLP